MIKILELVKMQLRISFQSVSSLLFYFIMPILFTFLFSMTEGEVNSTTIYVDDQDNSFYSREVIRLVSDSGLYEIIDMPEAQINEFISEEEGLQSGFIIPEGFGENIQSNQVPTIKVIKIMDLSTGGTEFLFTSAINKLQQTSMAAELTADILKKHIPPGEVEKWKDQVYKDAGEHWKAPKVTMDFAYLETSKTINQTGNQSSAGYLAFFLAYAMILGAGELLKEKEAGTLKRLLISTVSKNEILVSKFLGTFFLGIAQIVTMIIFGMLVIKVSWMEYPLWISLLLLAYLFALVSLGMLLSGFIKTHSQLNAIGILLIVGTSMLGGTWWSLEVAPMWMQYLGRITPQSWFMTSATGILGNNFDLRDTLTSIGVLLGMGLTAILISVRFISVKKLID